MEEKERDEIVFNTVDRKNVPCLTCWYGLHNYLAINCVKYEMKPSEVFYNNQKCPNYKPIKKN